MQPSIGKSIHLLLDPETMQFGEVVQDIISKGELVLQSNSGSAVFR